MDGEVSTTYINSFDAASHEYVRVFHPLLLAATNPSGHVMYTYPPVFPFICSSVEEKVDPVRNNSEDEAERDA